METTCTRLGADTISCEQQLLISPSRASSTSSPAQQPASRSTTSAYTLPLPPDSRLQNQQDGRGQSGGTGNPAFTPSPPHKDRPPSPPLSLTAKIGSWAIIVFSIGPFLILASMGFLIFLWSANATNSTWKTIVQKNWTITAVTMCSEVIKQVISFQLGLMVAMLAALALERSEVLISQIASFSMMRAIAGGGTTVVILWHYLTNFWYMRRLRPSLVSTLVFLSCLLYGLVQVISILLASDIDLVMIPGPTKTANICFAFAYQYLNQSQGGVVFKDENGNIIRRPQVRALIDEGRSGTWYRKPPAYPAFAEYTEPPYKAEGVSDTGMTLRAFVPLQSVQERETLMEYSGPATVLDARVTCQSPELIDPRVLANSDTQIRVTGAVRAAHNTPRLGNFTARYWEDRTPFSCRVPMPDKQRQNDTEWAISICQLALETGWNINGGLISEFKDNSTWWETVRTNGLPSEQTAFYGNAYLVLNLTTGDSNTWPAILEQVDAGENLNTGGYRPPAYARRGEWYDMAFNKGHNILSVTLCHTAFDVAHMPVNITSTRNRTEPTPIFNSTSNKYTFPQIIRNLLPTTNQKDRGRGILTLLPKSSWIAHGDENTLGMEPWIRGLADLSRNDRASDKWFITGNTGNLSALVYDGSESRSSTGEPHDCSGSLYNNNSTLGSCTNIDPMHIALFQEIVQNGGTNQSSYSSVAFALQAMITMLSSIAYYDQLPQFDNCSVGVSSLTFYETATAPVRNTGLVVVFVAVAVEFCLSWVIVVVFLRGTGLSRIGATWSAVAQAATGDARWYLFDVAGGFVMSDGMVEESMREDGLDRTTRSGLVRDEISGKVQVAVVARVDGREKDED